MKSVRHISAICLSAIALLPLTVLAQDGHVPGESVLRTLFPMPTGTNGYEDLVLAGELARTSKALESATRPSATLTAKRAAVADPAVRKSLALLRAGLEKPIHAPRSPSGDSTFEAFSLLRTLGRLISIEIYVSLADGRIGDSVTALRDGLRLGYSVQKDMIIGGMVGAAIDST